METTPQQGLFIMLFAFCPNQPLVRFFSLARERALCGGLGRTAVFIVRALNRCG